MSVDHAPAEPTDCNDCSEGPSLPRNVRLATGEFVWRQEDLRIAGRGLDFEWTRTYRSRPESGGRHWDHAYNLRAEATRGGIRVWNGSGAADLYRPGSTGTYAARGVFAEGRLDAANQFHLRFSGGGSWEFRPLDDHPTAGHIARIVDRNGNSLHFAYDVTGRLEVVTDTLGRDIRIGHDRSGRLATLTDFTGRRVSYHYGMDGNLESVTYPAVTGTPTDNDFPDGASVTYTYSAGNRLAGITDRAGKPLLDIEYTAAFDHDRVSSLRWGRAGKPVHITYHPTEEGPAAVLAIVNDGNGNVRDLLFDKLDACVGIREYTARADATKPTTPTENRPARPVREGEPPSYETRYNYDNPDGLLTRIVRPDGSTTEKEFEIDLRPNASPIERGNLRSIRYTPGTAGGDQPELVRKFDYLADFGCTCGQAFVTRETDTRGAVRSIEYDDRGNPVLIVERDGARTQLTYNAFGDVIKRGHTADETGARRRDVFEYSERHGQLTGETLDADGMALKTMYHHDELGRLVLLQDPAGHEHRHLWNAWDLLVRRVLPDSAGAQQSTEDTRYDVNRRPVARVVRESGREVILARTYDALGRLRTVSRQAEAGRLVVTTYEYDGNGNRVATRRGESHVVRLSYDTLDRPYQRSRGERGKGYREVTFDYDPVGNLVRMTRGSGAERSATRTHYDGYGRVVKIEAPSGTTVSFSRDPNGNVLRQVVRGPGDAKPVAEVSQTFDAMDRLTQRTTAGAGAAEPAVESWEFDARSRLVRRVDIAGSAWRARYDALDRPVEIDDGSGRVTTYAYDGNSNVLEAMATHRATDRRLRTRYVRDPRGRVLEVTAPQGMSRKYTYDVYDRPGTIGLPGERRIGLDYDGLGRPTRAHWVDPDDANSIEIHQAWDDSSHLMARTDPSGNITRYAHDAAGNLVAIEHADGTKETYSFDTRGNCVGWTDPNGTKVVNSYDPMDRLVRRDITPGAGVATDTTTESYQYDELGRLIRATNDRHTVEWTYDALSRVVTQVQDGRAIQATYDSRGRRTSVGYPSGYRLDFDYDGADLRRIRDPRGAAVELDAGGMIRYARTPVVSTTEWNAAGLPERLVTAAGATTLDERRYRWDESGNVTGIEVRDPRGTRSVTYTVDSLGRLRASAASAGQDVEYELDPAGNRTVVRVDGKEGRYSMDGRGDRATNRYTATPVDRRAYDANGNLLTVTDERGHRRSMRYDYLNRMVEYRDEAAGSVTRYGYDCLGRRLVKSMSEEDRHAEVRYVFDADTMIEEQDAAAGTTRSLLRHGRLVYGMVTGAASVDRWFIADALGSVVAEFDESGTIMNAYEYGDYGHVSIRDKSGAAPVLFAGYTYDEESELYYLRTRYLEPATGRFTTRDPAGVWEDGRNRGNAYAYAGNNPATFLDPTGLSTITLYSCNGPWPGPRIIKVEYEGCSKARRRLLVNPVCRAFRASGQSTERVVSLWINDLTGVPQAGANTTRLQVQKWFGGPDNATNLNSKSVILNTLDDVFDAIKSDDFDIDCEGGSGNCTGVGTVAYVNWGGWDVNLTNMFFNCFATNKQASILIHELTHAYNDTDDYFYYEIDGSNQPWNLWIETVMLRENADTYAQFTLDFFLP